MNNLEMINNIFDKTKEISGHLWGNMYGPKLENTQMSHILYYLSLTAGYLKSKEEDEVFKISELGLEIPSMSFYFEGGLLSLVKFMNSTQKPIHKNVFYTEKKTNEYESVEVSLQYVDDITCRLSAFANNISTPEGGTHVTGFKTALTRTLNTYGRKNNLIKESDKVVTF